MSSVELTGTSLGSQLQRSLSGGSSEIKLIMRVTRRKLITFLGTYTKPCVRSPRVGMGTTRHRRMVPNSTYGLLLVAFVFCVVFVFSDPVPVRVLYGLLTRHVVVVSDFNHPPSFFLFYFRPRLSHEQCVRAESSKFHECIEKSFIFIQRLPNL